MSKRKWIVVITTFVILLFCFILLLPIPIELKREIKIESSLVNVSSQVTDLQNWAHWHPLLINKDTTLFSYSNGSKTVNATLHIHRHDFTIVKTNPVDITIDEKDEEKEIFESLTIKPDAYGRFTYVQWIKVITPYIWLKERYNLTSEIENGLQNLKNFMEDPYQFYGFPIEIRPVVDTLVIIKQAVVTENDLHNTIQKLFSNLQQYTLANKINGNVKRIAGFIPAGNNKVEVTAGLVVNKKAPEKEDIHYLTMPKEGRMLVGHFDGDYKNIKLLYNALEKFITDKHLKTIAMPYEKYLTDPYSSEDSLHMKIEVYFPIL